MCLYVQGYDSLFWGAIFAIQAIAKMGEKQTKSMTCSACVCMVIGLLAKDVLRIGGKSTTLSLKMYSY